MDLHGDVESGPISKVERALFVANSVLFHKQNLRRLFVLWLLFVCYAFDVHSNAYHLATAAVPNGSQALANIQDIVQNATELFEDTPAKRYSRVLANPQHYRRTVSKTYDFEGRLRNEYALSKITETMQDIMKAHEYACLAAIHVGIPTRVMMIGDEVFVNPSTEPAGGQIQSTEESAFTPGVKETVQRFNNVVVRYQTLEGTWTSKILQRMQSVCAQHCVDAMGHEDSAALNTPTSKDL